MEKMASSSKLIFVLAVLLLLSFQVFGEETTCKKDEDCPKGAPYCSYMKCFNGKCYCLYSGKVLDDVSCSKSSDCDKVCKIGMCLQNGKCQCLDA